MPRNARIVIPRAPHHVTQRGSRRGAVFFCEQDRRLYLSLLQKYSEQYSTKILAYCLMENHVHLVVVPDGYRGLTATLKNTHMRYAQVVNGLHGWTGHLWQERFFSAPLDEDYFWAALRYVERNPVTAGLVSHAADYRWSSARAHCDGTVDPTLSDDPFWSKKKSQQQDWFGWLACEGDGDQISLLRERTARHLPCGNDNFISNIELELGRKVIPRHRGRPKAVNLAPQSRE